VGIRYTSPIHPSAIQHVFSNGRRFIVPVLCVLTLTACSKTLDHEKIAQTIQQDVIKQGGTSLKKVTCPKNIEPKAGEEFNCIGEIETGYTFTIPVKQQDAQGNVTWKVPNAKGLLNLASFETQIQEALTSEYGSRPIIDCGDGYKAFKPGQTFECKVTVKPGNPKDAKDTKASAGKDAKATEADAKDTKDASKDPKAVKTVALRSSKPDKIVVTTDTDSNVSWQRVMPGSQVKTDPKTAKAGAADAGKQPDAAKPGEAAPSPTSNASPVPAKPDANQFLDQPGASDKFED